MDAGFEHLREAMAQVFAERIEFPLGCLVTVLKAKTTANTAHAAFTLSVLPTSKEADVRSVLDHSLHELKDGLAKHVRLRRIPRLHFMFSRAEEKAEEMERLINSLDTGSPSI